MKTVLITGVSSGIGRAAAESFLSRGYRVIGSVRQSQSIQDLKNQFGNQLIEWNCDLLQLENVDSIEGLFKQNNITQIDILVNNAGVALAAPFQDQNFAEVQATMTLNVLAVMKLTQILIPYLAVSQGRIINISSVSGKSGTPFLAAYCASKHAIEGFSESLRREMNLLGIKVILIGPGSIKTPIWSKGFTSFKQSEFSNSFERFLKFAADEEKNGLPTSAVVSDILHASEATFPKIRYAPIPRKIRNWYFPRLLPKCLVDRMMCKALGLAKGRI